MNEQVSNTNSSSSNRTQVLIGIVAAGAIIALGMGIHQMSQTDILRRQVMAAWNDNAELRTKMVQSDAELRNSVAGLQQELSAARRETTTSVAKAGQFATRHADQLAQQQKEQAQQISDELGKVKETTVQAAARLDGISTDVGSVKTEVGSVKTEVGAVRSDVEVARNNIEQTRSDLQHVRGDLGLMSGLVATNGKEIQQLRDLGDRNIFEFNIAKTGVPQKVGDIQVVLRKVDTKRNRYTLDVVADDKKVEKKDKGMNEPVQFYTASARQPYELVVNKVGKDQVVGYLATPRVTVARNATALRP